MQLKAREIGIRFWQWRDQSAILLIRSGARLGMFPGTRISCKRFARIAGPSFATLAGMSASKTTNESKTTRRRLSCKTLNLTSQTAKQVECFEQRKTPFALLYFSILFGRNPSRLVRARQRGLEGFRSKCRTHLRRRRREQLRRSSRTCPDLSDTGIRRSSRDYFIFMQLAGPLHLIQTGEFYFVEWCASCFQMPLVWDRPTFR
jgi:hypothetical protein